MHLKKQFKKLIKILFLKILIKINKTQFIIYFNNNIDFKNLRNALQKHILSLFQIDKLKKL